MASANYDPKTGTALFCWRYPRGRSGIRHKKTAKVASAREADRIAGQIEQTIQYLDQGVLALPSGADVETVKAFIWSGGKFVERPRAIASATHGNPPEVATLASVLDTYMTTLTPGSKEANSIGTEAVHTRHLKRVVGGDRPFDSLGLDVLQRYVDRRSADGVVRDTVRKELATLRVVWGWASKRKLVATPPNWKMADLPFPKAHEKPPFQTWDQITRRIARGGLKPSQEADRWESLWLDQSQTVECLKWVRQHAKYPFVHPMIAFAAYTGARRSEIVRSERDDWDFETGVVSIRQKKADRSKTFTRRSVPIHPALADVMKAWFGDHPGGSWAIAIDDASPLTPRMATKYFRGAMAGGRWRVLHGFHTFRHSLASNMASAGVDQRLINAILGHHTEEMERRYRHLLPQNQEHALHALFRPGAAV